MRLQNSRVFSLIWVETNFISSLFDRNISAFSANRCNEHVLYHFMHFFFFIGNKSCVKSEYINTVEFIKRGFFWPPDWINQSRLSLAKFIYKLNRHPFSSCCGQKFSIEAGLKLSWIIKLSRLRLFLTQGQGKVFLYFNNVSQDKIKILSK